MIPCSSFTQNSSFVPPRSICKKSQVHFKWKYQHACHKTIYTSEMLMQFCIHSAMIKQVCESQCAYNDTFTHKSFVSLMPASWMHVVSFMGLIDLQIYKFIIYIEWSTQMVDQEQWQNMVLGLYNILASLYSVTDAYVGSASIVHVFSSFLSATAVLQFLYVLIGHTIFICCYLAPLTDHWILFVSIGLAWLGLARLGSARLGSHIVKLLEI